MSNPNLENFNEDYFYLHLISETSVFDAFGCGSHQKNVLQDESLRV